MTFTIIAHRGDSANAPENTLAAFDAAVQQGFVHFETDAQLTADGQVDVLTRYKGHTHIHLELKTQQPELPAAVAALLQQLGWIQLAALAEPGMHAKDNDAFKVPGLTITSFHLQQLQASKVLLPHVAHGWLIQETTRSCIDTAARSGFAMLCPRANALTAAAVAEIKQQGLAVRAWGVRSIELLHHVVSCGADGATVNWPGRAAQALQQ
eukprot:gene4189-4437_t